MDAGATLNVDGAYAGSAGDDTFTVAGIVSGTGNIDLGDGNDVLTLQDGAVLSAVIDGGNAVGGDTVVLDNASDFTFDGTNVTGFEQLVKQNTGTATLVGTHMYDSTSIDSGTLDVDGTLETATVALADDATLNVDGSVQAAGATQTAITGSTGVNSIIVNSGSTLLATGDLGDGNDVLDVAGTFIRAAARSSSARVMTSSSYTTGRPSQVRSTVATASTRACTTSTARPRWAHSPTSKV